HVDLSGKHVASQPRSGIRTARHRRGREMNYSSQHRFYCGVDLHARTMFTHTLDHKGKTVFEQDLPADPAAFLKAIKPYRKAIPPSFRSRQVQTFSKCQCLQTVGSARPALWHPVGYG